jgi:hypothetical protein
MNEHVYIGPFMEIVGQREFRLGDTVKLTDAQVEEMDNCRAFFISKQDFDSIFGTEDKPFLSPRFVGEWPGAFSLKLEEARDIVRHRKEGRKNV